MQILILIFNDVDRLNDSNKILILFISIAQQFKNWNWLKTYELGNGISRIIQLPSGEIVTFMEPKTIQIRNPYTGVIIRNLTGHTNDLTFAYLPKHRILASGSMESTIKLWNITNGALIKTLTDHIDWVLSLVVLPNGFLASGGGWNDSTVKIWNPDNNFSLERSIKFSGLQSVVGMTLLKDGNLAIGDDWPGDLFIVNPNTGALVKQIPGAHSRTIWNIAVMSNGDFITGSIDSSIKVWSGSDYSLKKTLTNQNECFVLDVLPNDYLACGIYNYTLIWDINTAEVKQRLLSNGTRVFGLVLLKNGELVTGGVYSMKLWSTTGNLSFLFLNLVFFLRYNINLFIFALFLFRYFA